MTISLRTAVAACLISLGLNTAAQAQETILRLSSWLPPAHPVVRDIVKPWTEQVEKETDGRVRVQILDAPLGAPPAHFDLAANGVVDLTFGVHSYTPGRFPLTELVELPFIGDSAESLSVAFHRIFESDLAAAGEHRGVKVLGLFVHGPGLLFTRNYPVSPVSGLAGAKIRVAGKVTNQLVEGLGMVSIQAPATDSYELLSGGVIDGTFFPLEAVPFFRIDTQVDRALRVPGGIFNAAFFFVMNEARFNRLSEADRAAIQRISGEAFARMAGQAWDRSDAASKDSLGASVAFHDASEDDLAVLRAAAQPIYDEVAANYSAKGLDFETVLKKLKAEIEAVEAE